MSQSEPSPTRESWTATQAAAAQCRTHACPAKSALVAPIATSMCATSILRNLLFRSVTRDCTGKKTGGSRDMPKTHQHTRTSKQASKQPARPRDDRIRGRLPGPGDGGFVIEFGGVCYQDTYPMYLACILYVFCMYLDVIRSYTSRYTKIHQDTSRYIKIHQDTFVSISLAIMEMYLTLGYVSFFTIHSRYIQDTFKIHSRYIQDTFRIQCILTLRYMSHKIHS